MLSFEAAWSERGTEISWINTGQKKLFSPGTSGEMFLDDDAKWFLCGFSFTLRCCMPEASFSLPLSSGVSFQEGQNWGNKYLSWQEP